MRVRWRSYPPLHPPLWKATIKRGRFAPKEHWHVFRALCWWTCARGAGGRKGLLNSKLLRKEGPVFLCLTPVFTLLRGSGWSNVDSSSLYYTVTGEFVPWQVCPNHLCEFAPKRKRSSPPHLNQFAPKSFNLISISLVAMKRQGHYGTSASIQLRNNFFINMVKNRTCS